jgi:uncharacterized membrane protein
MTGSELVPAIVLFVHNLFTALWIGGMIVIAVGVAPAARRTLDGQPAVFRLLGALQARLRWFVYAGIVVLPATGIMLARRNPGFEGFFAWGDTYSIALSLKHGVVIAMVVVALVRSLALAGPRPAAPAPAGRDGAGGAGVGRLTPTARRARLSMSLLLLNIALGCVVLFLSAVTAIV